MGSEREGLLKSLRKNGGSMNLYNLSMAMIRGRHLGFGVETIDVVDALRLETKVSFDKETKIVSLVISDDQPVIKLYLESWQEDINKLPLRRECRDLLRSLVCATLTYTYLPYTTPKLVGLAKKFLKGDIIISFPIEGGGRHDKCYEAMITAPRSKKPYCRFFCLVKKPALGHRLKSLS